MRLGGLSLPTHLGVRRYPRDPVGIRAVEDALGRVREERYGSRTIYEGLDFHVTSRSPSHGDPVHVELTLDRFTIGISTVTAAREDHGLDPQLGGRPVEIVLYCDDVDGEVVRLTAGGAPLLSEPHPFQGGLGSRPRRQPRPPRAGHGRQAPLTASAGSWAQAQDVRRA